MIDFYEDDELRICSDLMPAIAVRAFLPNDTKGARQEKRRKPYTLRNSVNFQIKYKKNFYIIPFKEDYIWDGASIPFMFRPLIGKKGSLEFLLPSMVHDRMCEEPKYIKHNRNLSSKIFRALLISTGVGKFRANIMYHAVDNYQKLKSWDEGC